MVVQESFHSRVRRFLKGGVVSQLWRMRNVELCDRIVVDGTIPHLHNAGTLRLGSRVSFRGHGARSRLTTARGGTIEIGDRSFINSGVKITAASLVRIGSNALIGEGVEIYDLAFHQLEEGADMTVEDVIIGRNVWIGNGARIMPGVVIGDHSVVAAGAVVTKSVPGRCLVGGVPARQIRTIRASDSFVRR